MMIQMLDFVIQSPHHCTTGAVSRHIKRNYKKGISVQKHIRSELHILELNLLEALSTQCYSFVQSLFCINCQQLLTTEKN